MISSFQLSRDEKDLNQHPTTDISNMYSKFNVFGWFFFAFCLLFLGGDG
jgi:hypothetical protein